MIPAEPHDQEAIGAPDLPARIRRTILDTVATARRRRTARDLEREIANREGCPRPVVQTAIRGLVEAGVLEYRYTYGQSYLAMSFRRPVDVSPRFTIVPPGYAGGIPPNRIPIAIAPGAAFGDGGHPTTRLALQAIEMAWDFLGEAGTPLGPVAMDIGTGTGVLAIAAARLGMETVFALEIDACARSEAQNNIALNPLSSGIHVTDRPLETFDGMFDLVMANLRLPTLVGLADWVASHLKPRGCVVVSGCREEEWDCLSSVYVQKGLCCGNRATTGGWSGGLFRRKRGCPPKEA